MATKTQDPPAPTAAAPAGTTKRVYGIYTELELDITDPIKLVEALKSAGEGKVTVLARVGEQENVTPKAAMKKFSEDNDLDGDYEAIANSSRTKFPGLKTGTKRTVSGL